MNVASRFARDGSVAHASFVYETCQPSQLIARPMDKVGEKVSHGKQRDSVYVKCKKYNWIWLPQNSSDAGDGVTRGPAGES